ncbi:MAG: hypothetical protein R6X06_10700 [Gammaproteobacteria bacterium]
MRPWILLDSAPIPGQAGELRLYQRGEEYSIKISGRGELMNSRDHDSEQALAAMTCARLQDIPEPRLLIGGLGMGYTLAAALQHAPAPAHIEVAELLPAVVRWNRGPLAACAGAPLQDPRVTVQETDVARLIKGAAQSYDAILLDVDNGPEGLTSRANDWLYSAEGLSAAYVALRLRGILAVWSAGSDPAFSQRLYKAGFTVEEVRVRAHGNKGARYVIWFARVPG